MCIKSSLERREHSLATAETISSITSLGLLIRRYAATRSAWVSQQKLMTLEFFSTILSASHPARLPILASLPTPINIS